MVRNEYGCVIAGGQIIKADPGCHLVIKQVKNKPVVPELLGKGVPNVQRVA
jgi:glyoxylate carboligase